MDHGMRCLGLHVYECEQVGKAHALELRVETAPAGHAVDIRRNPGLGQREHLVVAQRERLAVDQSKDLEVPRFLGYLGDASVVQHWPLLGQILTRWYSGGRFRVEF